MRQISIKGRAFPSELNHTGTVFGGWVMSKMDKAASIQVEEIINSTAVTVSVSNLEFLSPVYSGDVFTVYTHVLKIGRTSMDISVELIVRSKANLTEHKVTKGIFRFVAIGKTGKPVEIRSVLRNHYPEYINELLK